jgi:predicted AlkP superfamily pyrophosphatase or phosphodiesterase
MDALIVSGKRYIGVERGPHTVSAPGWTAILTGVWSDKHGVTDNSYEGSNLGSYPDLFTRLRNTYSCARLCYSNSHPIVSTGLLSAADQGTVTNDDERALQEALRLLDQCKPDVLFVHLDDIDAAGHDSGFSPDNPDYIEHISDADRQVGMIVQAFEATYPEHQRLIVLATDHGGEGKSHGGKDNNPNVTKVFLMFSCNNSLAWKDTMAEVVDVVPTVFRFLNTPVDTVWELDGKDLFEE